MAINSLKIYPDCPIVKRTIEAGGMTKQQLLQRLQQASILMNEYGERLFSDDLFPASAETYMIETVELTVLGLVFSRELLWIGFFKERVNWGWVCVRWSWVLT